MASFFYSKSSQTDSVYSFEEKYRPSLQIRNQYLNILSTIGIFGLITYFCIFFYILKSLLANKEDSIQMVLYSILAILIHSIFYFQTDNILIVFWVLCGLTLNNTTTLKIKKKYINKLILSFCFIISIFFLFIFTRITLAEFKISLSFSKQNLQDAIKLNPYYDYYPKQLALLYFQDALNNVDNDKSTAERNIIEVNSLLNRAYYLSNYDYENIVLLSRVNYWAGININKSYHNYALYWAKMVIKLDPTNYANYDLLGLIYLDKGNLNAAFDTFNKEKALDPKAPVIYLHIGEVLKQKGQLNKALEQYNRALLLNPNYDLAKSEIDKIQNLLKTE
jgi:tetratricopeptide (TPR) repeat protein